MNRYNQVSLTPLTLSSAHHCPQGNYGLANLSNMAMANINAQYGDTYRQSPPSNTNATQLPGSTNAQPSGSGQYQLPPNHQHSYKRKIETDPPQPPIKRRKEADAAPPPPDAALDDTAGLKHWTDDDKSRLFEWLMGPTQDDNWNSFRATKNSCLRDVRPPPCYHFEHGPYLVHSAPSNSSEEQSHTRL